MSASPSIGEVIENADRLRSSAIEAQTTFGAAIDGVDLKPRSGFSLRLNVDGFTAHNNETVVGQIMVETLSIDEVIFIRISDTLGRSTNDAIVGYRVLQADGRPLPDWVRQVDGGLLLIEVPAGELNLDLKLTTVSESGEMIKRVFSVELKTGEVSEKSLDVWRASTFSEQLRAAGNRR